MNHTVVKCVMFSRWKYESGCVPTRIVMWKQHPELPTSTYATHYEMRREDGQYDFGVGHYDMTLEEARADFDKRCKLLGVEFSHFSGDSIAELERKLKELDPEVEGEEYEGKKAGILAELEALADSAYCKAHDC